MIGFYAAGAMGQGGGGGGTLFEELMADSPWAYFRHGEPSGSTMENEVGTDGSYTGGPSLGNAALYTGGPTCVYMTSGDYGGLSVTPPAVNNQLSLVTVVNLVSNTGLPGLISRDNGSSVRSWQWRLSGGNMQFIVVSRNGGIDPETLTAAHGMSTGNSYIVGVTVASSGLTTLYVNGASIGSTTISGTLMLGNSIAGGGFEIGAASVGLSADTYFSESAIFYSDVGSARMAAYAAAAGL